MPMETVQAASMDHIPRSVGRAALQDTAYVSDRSAISVNTVLAILKLSIAAGTPQ